MKITSRYVKFRLERGEKMKVYEKIKKYMDDNGIKQKYISDNSNIPENTLNVLVSDEELAKRKEKWQPREPKVTTGYLSRYRELVTSGNRGAILEVQK